MKPPPRFPAKVIILAVIIFAEITGIIWLLSQRQPPSLPPSSRVNNQTPTPQAQKQQPSLALSPTTSQLKVGDTLQVTIVLSAPNQKINGADVIITYDPQLITITDSSPQTPGVQTTPLNLFPTYPINRVDPQSGRISITGLAQSPARQPLTQPQNFATFTLTAIAPGTAKFDFLFTPNDTTSSTIIQTGTSQNILTRTSGATYTINP